MALTRKMLTAMGIESEKIDQIIESHTETVDGLKKQAADYKELADKVPELEKQIQQLEDAKPTEDWEKKYNDLNDQFEQYKATVATEKADAEKKRLYQELVRAAGITSDRLVNAILNDSDLTEVLVKDGKIEGAEELQKSIAEEWKDFIPQTSTQGAQVATPPDSSEPDTGADPATLKRLQERQERLYGKIEGE